MPHCRPRLVTPLLQPQQQLSFVTVLIHSLIKPQQMPGDRIGSRLATSAMMLASSDGDLAFGPSEDGSSTWVSALHRFAVKGLDHDRLEQVNLEPGGGFPYDRKWALHLDASPNRFTPMTPNYLHKSAFLCAFTANVLLASFATQFDDAARTLTVSRRRGAGAAAGPLLQESLESGEGRERIAAFFSNASGRAVTVVGGEGDDQGRQRHHQFGNTESGIRVGDGSTRTIHLVNANTVADLSAKSGVPLHVDRFRANVILQGGLPAWHEFQWVGRTIQLGAATLRVIKRTRCGVMASMWTRVMRACERAGRLTLTFPRCLQGTSRSMGRIWACTHR
jgi:uncharacterized protein YcbX